MATLKPRHDVEQSNGESPSVTVRRVLDCCGCGVASDYVRSLNQDDLPSFPSPYTECELVDLTRRYIRPILGSLSIDNSVQRSAVTEVVLFTNERLGASVLRAFRWIAEANHLQPVKCIVVVNSLERHLNHTKCDPEKDALRENLLPLVASLTILRTGFILSPSSRTTRWTQRFFGTQTLLPARWMSTFVSGDELFSAIEWEFINDDNLSREGIFELQDAAREITVLGERRSWSDVIEASDNRSATRSLLQVSCSLLQWTGLPWLIYYSIICVGNFSPVLRQYFFQALKPRSTSEIVSLYNRHNFRHVQLAGYNNGVNHFGWKFPGKTVVLTTGNPGTVVISDDRNSVFVNAGQTLNQCIRELRHTGLEFHVVPNYSWISMGTLFFVPVHGSGSRVSTLSDTIESVTLFDGEKETYVEARRGDLEFCDAMYNRDRPLLLLRLSLRVKPCSNYLIRKAKIAHPAADDILRIFADTEAANVEIRKNKAASAEIDVNYYYADSNCAPTGPAEGTFVEVPRDRIGRVWDRLEETPIVSSLFHWFVRTFAFHVELFLKPDEFSIFWQHHQSLPVSKIQLRRVLKDEMPHSACEHQDCISADLFMTRKNRDAFCQFIATHLPHVRTNPGKQTF